MPRVVGVDHIALRVSDFPVSRRFYDRLLTFLGFVLEWDLGTTVGWNNGVTMVWIAEADAEGRRHRHRTGDVGFHHYAFELGSRAEVDELGDWLAHEGVEIVDPPAAYPSYGEGYYAVFFLDPDGMKLEGMYFLEKVKRAGAPPELTDR
jgi:catechol 2,3-dioxygenase-like lactoylglutathione lyase family enzyme